MKTTQKILVAILVGFIALFLQGTLLKLLLPAHAIPSFCLLFVIFLAFNEVSVSGAVLSFLLGMQFDLSSGLIIGPWSGAFTATYTVLCLMSRRVFLDSMQAACFIVFVSSIFANVIYTGLLYQFHPAREEVLFVLLESVATAVIAPLVLFIYKYFLVKKWNVYGARASSSV